MRFIFIGSLLGLLSGADAIGCKGGDTFNGGGDGCNLNSVTCTQESCEDMGGTWTDDCPPPDPNCDPLAPSDEDPPCTGPPEAIDRFGKKMYRRELIASEKPEDSDEGVFCHITLALCPGESMITQGIDPGFGDYYRIGATSEWCDYSGTSGYRYGGMHNCDGARSYSPVAPLNENTAQFIIRKDGPNPRDYNCTAGIDCKFGMSELACFAPLGSEFLLSAVTDHAGTDDSTHYAYRPNFSMMPGSGPYTFNFIGQGVALTELNIAVMSGLLNPFSSDGSFSTIKEINYLWANSYWSNAAWVFEGTESTDLVRKMIREDSKYGIRFNLMHSISREQRPEAEWPRTDVTVIGQAFNLINTTNQDPNVKWLVVGSSDYKRALYPQILEWGFDLRPCSEAAERKGYPYCGTNSLYEWEAPGADGYNDRERSDLFKYYESLPPPTSTPTSSPTKAPTTAPTSEPTSPPCQVNVCLALDMSGSICSPEQAYETCFGCTNTCFDSSFNRDTCCANFNGVKNFAVAVMDSLPEDTEFSVVPFAENGAILMPLSSPSLAKSAVRNLVYSGGYTNHAEAISLCQETLAQSTDTDRQNVILLVTDGVTNRPYPNATLEAESAAHDAKSGGTSIHPVFIKPDDQDEVAYLEDLSSNDQVIVARSFDELSSFEELVSQIICGTYVTTIKPSMAPSLSTYPTEHPTGSPSTVSIESPTLFPTSPNITCGNGTYLYDFEEGSPDLKITGDAINPWAYDSAAGCDGTNRGVRAGWFRGVDDVSFLNIIAPPGATNMTYFYKHSTISGGHVFEVVVKGATMKSYTGGAISACTQDIVPVSPCDSIQFKCASTDYFHTCMVDQVQFFT